VLVLKRRNDDWITIRHRSGDVIRIKTYDFRSSPATVQLAFDDPDRNYEIQRDEKPRPAKP